MKIHVMVGIPSANDVNLQTLLALHGLIADTRSAAQIQVVKRVGSPTDKVRNALVEEFLARRDCTHLLFVDSDVAFPSDGLDKLLALDAPIAAGTYPMIGTRVSSLDGRERLNLSSVIGRYADSRHGKETPEPEAERIVYRWLDAHKLNGGAVPCDGVGTGFCMIRRDVFEALERPWFRVCVDAADRVTTEDLYFCRKALQAGFSIKADPTVSCEHYKRIDLSRLEELFTDAEPEWPWIEQPPPTSGPEDARVMLGTIGQNEWLNLRLSDFIFQQLSNPAARVAKVSYNFGSDWVRVCNQVFDEFLDHTDCTHLFLLANEVCPDADFLLRALAVDAPFAGACRRIVADNEVQYEAGFVDAFDQVSLFTDLEPWRRESPSEVDYIGLSATLVQRRLIETWERPILPVTDEPRKSVAAFCRRVRESADVAPMLLPTPCLSFAEVGLKPLLDLKARLQKQSLAAV